MRPRGLMMRGLSPDWAHPGEEWLDERVGAKEGNNERRGSPELSSPRQAKNRSIDTVVGCRGCDKFARNARNLQLLPYFHLPQRISRPRAVGVCGESLEKVLKEKGTSTLGIKARRESVARHGAKCDGENIAGKVSSETRFGEKVPAGGQACESEISCCPGER